MSKNGAYFSDDRRHRYLLWRELSGNRGTCNFIMLNPSTADETANDPTVTRCIGYAKRWGYGKLYVTNIFAFRATDPKELKKAEDPVGQYNNTMLCCVAGISDLVVCAWGAHGAYQDRDSEVRELLEDVPTFALKLTKEGYPWHPLYLPNDIELLELK